MSIFSDLKKKIEYKMKRKFKYDGPIKISLKREVEIFELLDKILTKTGKYKSDAIHLRDNSNYYRNRTTIQQDKYKKVLEEELCKIVEENPELKYCVIDEGFSEKIPFGHYIVRCAFDKLATQIAEDDYALRMTEQFCGMPFPHYACRMERSEVVMKALENSNIHQILFNYNENIGHYIADNSSDVKCYLEALKNKKLRTAKDFYGRTMGHCCAGRTDQDFKVASIFTFIACLDQRDAVDKRGNNILMTMAKNNNYELANILKNPEILTHNIINRVNADGESFVSLVENMNNANKNTQGYTPLEIPKKFILPEEESMRESIVDYFEK
ncbi:MAG: hypothetical protein IJA61_03080 [Clostridia bacterium]|nr:hypothetical protein [Clostridia bacterium]